ncbi:MAG: lipopolysaccharide biosynthesis protein [Prevotellaceae bacterium]|jgi:O-antigen/teichoic acid export membrane protein|nr:lipopolysaccharide biosynthesis protein [Prevotellaceae bacterium]
MGIIIRQSIKGTLVTYIGAFIGFLTTMFVVTKFLSPEDIGLTKVVLEVGFLFSGLAQLGTSASIMRFFTYFKDGRNNNGFFFYIMALPLVGCIIFTLLYLILKEPVSDFFSEKSSFFIQYYYWIIPIIVFATYMAVLETYSNVNMRISVPKLNREIIIRVLMLAVYLLYGYQFVGRNGLVAGIIMVHGVGMLFMFFYVPRIGSVSLRYNTSFVTKPLRKDIFRYSIFLIVGALSGSILSKLDLFMVSSQLGLDHAGIFTIAFYIATVIEIPQRSISAISSPSAADALKQGDFQTANTLYQKVSLNQLLMGGFVFLLIWVNIDNIFAIIPNGDIYKAGKWVVFFIGISKLITVTHSFGGVLISFSKYYYWSLYFTFVLVAIGILTNYLLIPIWGISGAAVASTLTCLLFYLAQQWIVRVKVKGIPYSFGMVKLIAIFFIVATVNHFLARYSNPWVDGVYRTAIVSSISVALLYFLKVSDDVNSAVRFVLKSIFGRKKK